MHEEVELGGLRSCGGGGYGCCFAAFNVFERSFTIGAAVMVDVALGQGGAKPAHKGTSTGVRGKWRPPLAAGGGQTEQLGVERVGEVVAKRGRSGDGNGGLCERHAVETEETLPGGIAAEGTGLGQGEFGKMETSVEGRLLGRGWDGLGRLVEVMLSPGGSERSDEFGLCNTMDSASDTSHSSSVKLGGSPRVVASLMPDSDAETSASEGCADGRVRIISPGWEDAVSTL